MEGRAPQDNAPTRPATGFGEFDNVVQGPDGLYYRVNNTGQYYRINNPQFQHTTAQNQPSMTGAARQAHQMQQYPLQASILGALPRQQLPPPGAGNPMLGIPPGGQYGSFAQAYGQVPNSNNFFFGENPLPNPLRAQAMGPPPPFAMANPLRVPQGYGYPPNMLDPRAPPFRPGGGRNDIFGQGNNPVVQAPPDHIRYSPPPPAKRMTFGDGLHTRAQNDNNYAVLVKGAPPVNIQPPVGIDIGILEICTFFPCWFQIPEVACRAIRNNWDRREVAKAELHAIDKLTKDNLKVTENRVQKHFSEGGKLIQGTKGERWSSETFRVRNNHQHDLTAAKWELRCEYDGNNRAMQFEHISLYDVYKNVPRANWPTGVNRLQLTECLEFAYTHRNLDLDTSHFDKIIHDQGFTGQGYRLDSNHDVNALQWLRNNVDDPES